MGETKFDNNRPNAHTVIHHALQWGQMLSQTRRALEDFDNQHDFERMSADILNALGYSGVAPMAPGGGADGGRDILFREGDTTGIAFVTLEKRIRDKFKRDLAKQSEAEGLLALFCNVDVSPSLKLEFSREAMAKGCRLEVFDLERLRSLLDSSLKEIRRRYLGIDDAVSARLRSEVSKLLRFPAAIRDASSPPSLLEKMLTNKLPQRLFDLLMQYDEKDVIEVPGAGEALQGHLKDYYAFRQDILELEERLTTRIGHIVAVQFRQAWRIYLRYVLMRFGGMSQANITASGNFLNYDITWDDAERVFGELSGDSEISANMSRLWEGHDRLVKGIDHLMAALVL